MNSTMLHNQGHMATGSAASAGGSWLADARIARIRKVASVNAAAITTTPKSAVKPFHGYVRRPLEGSS